MTPAFKNILVATDFSTTGNNIINLSIELCKYYQATMHLIHVKESRYILADPLPGTIASEIANDIDQEARNRLYEIYESVLREHNIPMQIHMPTGIPFDEICKAASEMPIDLIIIGKHGTSGTGYDTIGTTTYNVVKYSIKPVLIIPYNFIGTVFRNILFPLQPTQDIKAKYELVRPFLNQSNVHIHIGVFELEAKDDDGNRKENDLPGIISELENEGIYCTNGIYVCADPEVKVLGLIDLLQSDLVVINSALDYKCIQFSVRPYTKEIVSGSNIPILCLRNCIDITDETKEGQIAVRGEFTKSLAHEF